MEMSIRKWYKIEREKVCKGQRGLGDQNNTAQPLCMGNHKVCYECCKHWWRMNVAHGQITAVNAVRW